MLMVASVNETQESVNEILEDEINHDTSFHFCNWFLKWNKMLVKQKIICVFEKNVKTFLQNKKMYMILHSRPFSSNFNFASKLDQVTAATCKYCALVVGPTITNCCKELYLICSRIHRSAFENLAMQLN